MVKNEFFCDYMERQKEQNKKNGRIRLTINKLIFFTQNKYNEHMEVINNICDTVSRHHHDIVALKSEMTNMRSRLNLVSKILKKHLAVRTNNN